ncbi:MAG: FkbM family methyltransferase [Verrucomicrobia bacterium]|nr:FkbM family methyltransferase [Verrucomicrobiota bacterium]
MNVRTRTGFVYRLTRFKATLRLVHALGIYRGLNFLLRCFPIVRRLPGNGTVLRIHSISGFYLQEEIFKTQAYRAATEGMALRTFADLGCNVGWFACYLLETTGDKGLAGVLIDGNPSMIEQAQWHLKKNGLADCHALWGVVGCSTESGETDFFVTSANVISSAKPFGENHYIPKKGDVEQIKAPALSLAKTWKAQFGDRPIDLLKIDIEGMELEFLQSEIEFIKGAVKRIVCEWHNWNVSFEDLNQFVEGHGFRLRKICEQDEEVGLAIYDSLTLQSDEVSSS